MCSSDLLGVEAAAILFLNCYANPQHEARAKAILERNHPGMFVSASHELSQEYREFERCSTVVANAYIGPKVRRYVGEIDEHIRSEGFDGSFLIVQSTGGLYEAEQAQSQCIRMLESGPAAGVIGESLRYKQDALRLVLDRQVPAGLPTHLHFQVVVPAVARGHVRVQPHQE